MADRIRVVLDARSAQFARPGGVGRQVTNLARELAPRCDLEVLLDARLPTPATLSAATGAAHTRSVRAPLPGFTAWLQLAVPRALGAGVFHGPFYALPFRQPVPMVVTLHDLSFESHPSDFTPAQLVAFRVQARHAARTAGCVVTVSEVVRQEIRDRYGVPGDRVAVVPNALDPVFLDAATGTTTESVLRRLGVERPYVVAMGGARRRRLSLALAACRLARNRLAELVVVVVGGEGVATDSGVVVAPSLDDASLAALLRGAGAFLYPTRYEGFGLPALEALACGAPVVCQPLPSLREVIGDAAAWCDGDSPDAFAAVLVDVLSDSGRADDLARKGRSRALAAPTWTDAADAHMRIYQQALADGRARRA